MAAASVEGEDGPAVAAAVAVGPYRLLTISPMSSSILATLLPIHIMDMILYFNRGMELFLLFFI